METWKHIKGYEGLYDVSSSGRIRSRRGKFIKLRQAKNGYVRVWLYRSIDKSYKPFSVHRLVAEVYLCNPQSKPFVNHKNGVKSDNRASNLEWVTQSENQIHAISTGLQRTKQNEDCQFAKLTNAQVIRIRSIHTGARSESARLARVFAVSPKTIRRIINRQTFSNI